MLLFSCRNNPPSTINEGDADKMVQPDTVKKLLSVRLLPYWVPSAQFAGYYVGVEKGIFEKHGISLEILPFDPQLSSASAIKDKKPDFALLWLVNAMEVREKGVGIVNICQFSSRSSLMLITKKSSGISKIEDMNGKKAAIWIGFEQQPRLLFGKYKLNVEMIPIGSSNSLFLQDGVDIINANWFDEYHSILNNGIAEDELNKFFLADYGFNFLEDGLYCLNQKMRDDPQLCRNFVEAVIESWNYAFSHEDEAIEIVIKYAKAHNQPVNKSHQSWMLKAYKALYIPDGKDSINTQLTRNDYETTQQLMIDSRLLTLYIPYDSIYKPCLGSNVNR